MDCKLQIHWVIWKQNLEETPWKKKAGLNVHEQKAQEIQK